MKYLIDGYNLAHQSTLPAGPVSPPVLAEARMTLVRRLADVWGERAGDVTVIFDTRRTHGIPPQESRFGIDVRFSIGEEADDLIERLIKAHSAPKQLTVVSDDRRLQAAAARRGCIAMGCQEFLDRLEDRPPTPVQAVEEKPAAGDDVAAWERAFSVPRPVPPVRRRPRNS